MTSQPVATGPTGAPGVSYPERARAAQTTRAIRADAGVAARDVMPLDAHQEVSRGHREDPIELLRRQSATRVPHLVPIRYGRMLTTPFTFFRGAAAVMSADLGSAPHSGLTVQLCGDAHVSNFGIYLTPERQQVFDMNDFDETHPGPFEWDVKRLAASIAVAGSINGFPKGKARSAARQAVSAYREEVGRLAAMGNLDVWYSQQEVSEMSEIVGRRLSKKRRTRFDATVTKARYRDSVDAVRKLCVIENGRTRIKHNPPLIVPGEEMMRIWGEDVDAWYDTLNTVLADYRRTLESDQRHLMDQYTFVEIGFKVVGVGSVGTRAWILLLDGADPGDPLVLQAKEAQESVLQPYATPVSGYTHQGERVVSGQRLIQMTSDIFLGWQRVTGVDGRQRDYYIRQLRDGKGSAAVERMDPPTMSLYGRFCGQTLARAHARSGDRIALAAYLGDDDRFDVAVADYAIAYTDRNRRDHAALQDAVDAGRITARFGI